MDTLPATKASHANRATGRHTHDGLVTGFLLLILAAVSVVSLLAGRVWVSPAEMWDGLFSSNATLASLIVTELRLPRTVLAIAVGATLGMCGAVLQGLTRNPLAEPGLLGVSAGASLGAVIAIYFGVSAYTTAAIPAFGLVGALGAMMLTFALGRGGGTLSLVLAGAAVTGFMFALIQLALNLAPSLQAAYEIMTWLMGSLADRSWDHVLLSGPFIILGCGMLAFTGRALDALSLGETQAEKSRHRPAEIAHHCPCWNRYGGRRRDVGYRYGRIHRSCGTSHRPSVRRIPAQPNSSASSNRGSGAVAGGGCRNATDPLRPGDAARRVHGTAGITVFLLAGRTAAEDVAVSEIAASDLVISRGGRTIVDNVSLQAQSGTLLAVIGANGAGKSTLLAALAGLLRPDTGTVRLDGLPISRYSRVEIARRRAYLPQNPRCEWPISVERLIALGLTPTLPVFGGLPSAFEGRITEMLAQSDLLAQRGQAATTLSGGELARAMLARSLVGNPDILIADEPTSGLDPRHALDTLARLRDLAHAASWLSFQYTI